MVTYIPTILMNMINQGTVYLRRNDSYELLITVNITCMMVLASVYLSVSSSLPSTPNIKPVELWLLFNLAYPFFITITAIIHQNLKGCQNWNLKKNVLDIIKKVEIFHLVLLNVFIPSLYILFSFWYFIYYEF